MMILFLLLLFSGCSFVGMAAAGFIGTVTGNLTSDFIGKRINAELPRQQFDNPP